MRDTGHGIRDSKLDVQVDALIAMARSGNEGEIRRKLKEIVPEYQPPARPEEAVAVPPEMVAVPPERDAIPSEHEAAARTDKPAQVFRVAGAAGD